VPEAGAAGLIRNDGGNLLARRLEDVGRLLKDTNDPEGPARDPHDLADRVHPAEEPVRRGLLQYRDIAAGQLASGEEPAPQERAALDLHVIVVGREDRHQLGPDPLVLQAAEQLDPQAGVADLGNRLDGLDILAVEDWPDPDFV